MNRKQIGHFGENIAKKFLSDKGYKILDQNYQNKWGEIDIVAKRKNKLIFVEVKTIVEKPCFCPEDEINQKKKRQLCKMAQIYLSAKSLGQDAPRQIDIIAVEVQPDFKKAKVRHHQNAIEDYY